MAIALLVLLVTGAVLLVTAAGLAALALPVAGVVVGAAVRLEHRSGSHRPRPRG